MGEAIHNRIAMLRAERGISRRHLADALGVHHQTVGYPERGEYSPGLHLALRIAAYFEVPVEVVFSVPPARHGRAHRHHRVIRVLRPPPPRTKIAPGRRGG
jgi:putative transcriptional regulator